LSWLAGREAPARRRGGRAPAGVALADDRGRFGKRPARLPARPAGNRCGACGQSPASG